jgi:antitoxin ParD1/3/4
MRALMVRDQAIEHWLRIEVAAAYDEMKADPAKALTLDQVRASLTAHRQRRTGQG